MKKWLSIVVSALLIMGSIVPVYGNQSAEMEISSWAVATLNEGEKYGIYSEAWYYEEFLAPITHERFVALLNAMAEKFESTGLEGNPEFVPTTVGEKLTRGDVATAYYNLLGYYGLVSAQDPIEAMIDLGVLKGTGSRLALETPCNVEQAVVMGIRTIFEGFQLMEAASKGLVWQVSNNDIVVYLLGSIHVGSTDLYPLHHEVLEAFYGSDILWVEANLLDQTSGVEEFLRLASYEDGKTLKSELDEALYAKLEEVFEYLGVPLEIYEPYRPWVLANELNLFVLSGSEADPAFASAELGIDLYFTVNAYLSGMPVMELEGMATQAAMFNSLSLETQHNHLEAVLDMILEPESDETLVSPEELMREWFDLWKKGDVERFEESFMNEAGDTESEFNTMLFGKRDAFMAERIHTLLQDDGAMTHFIVVGSGHLIGEHSIIQHLIQMGYTVESFH